MARFQIEINAPVAEAPLLQVGAPDASGDLPGRSPSSLDLLSPTTEPSPGLGAPPTERTDLTDVAGAMFRRENPAWTIIKNLHDAAQDQVTPEEFHQHIKEGFNHDKLILDIKTQAQPPMWITDIDNELLLRGTRSPIEFARMEARLWDEYDDRELIEQAPWYVTVPMALGAGLTDPISGLMGLGAGSILRGAIISNRAISAAGKSYKNLHDEIADQARYLTREQVDAVTKAQLADRASAAKLYDVAQAELKYRRGVRVSTSMFDATVGAATAEALLLNQPGRTGEEVLMNIVGSVAFSGALAGAGAYGGSFLRSLEQWNKGLPPDAKISKAELERARKSLLDLVYNTDSVNPRGGAGTTKTEARVEGEDNSPAFIEGVGGLLPVQIDEALKIKYGIPDHTRAGPMDPVIDPDTVNFAQYVRERAKLATEYTGVESSRSLRALMWLHPGLRMKVNQIGFVRQAAGLLIDSDYVEAGAHVNGRVRNVFTADNMIKTDEAEAQNWIHNIFTVGMNAIEKAGSRPGMNWTDPAAWDAWKAKQIDVPFLAVNIRKMAVQEEMTKYIHFKDTYDEIADPLFKGLKKEIKALADEYGAEISLKWQKRLLDSGVLKEAITPEGAAFYMTWRWDVKKIDTDQLGLEAMVRKQIVIDRTIEARQEIYKDYVGRLKAGKEMPLKDETIAKIEADAPGQARDFVNSIRGHPLHLASSDIPGAMKPGALKTRRITHTPEMLAFRDMNLAANTSAWIKSIAPEVRLSQLFGRDYTKNILDGVTAERDARVKSLNMLLKHYKDKGDNENIALILKEREDLDHAVRTGSNDLTRTVQVLRNEFGVPNDPDGILIKAGKGIRTWNYVTMLGGMTPSSMVDPALLFMKAGFGKSIKALGHGMGGWPGVYKGYEKLDIEYRARGTKAHKEFRNDVHTLGIVGEIIGNSRADAMAMVADPGEAGGQWNRFLNGSQALFSKATLMSRWNDWMKTTAGMSYTLKIEQAIASRDFEFLADMGINKKDAKGIAKAWKKHGVRQKETAPDGVEMDFVAPNMRQWHLNKDGSISKEGMEAQTLMTAVLRRAVDSTVVGPGVGDIPFFMRTPLGKALLQFQTFPIAVLSRIIIPTMQRVMPKTGDGWQGRAAMAGASAMVAILFGGAVYSAKTVFREGIDGIDTVKDNGWGRFFTEGVERSGLTGEYQVGLNVANQLAKGRFTTALFGEDYEQGYVPRDPIFDASSVLVSWYKNIQGAVPGAINILSGRPMTYSQGSAFRRLAWWNNLFYLQWFTRQVQDHAPFIQDKPRKKDED